jgi:hypothetical protein
MRTKWINSLVSKELIVRFTGTVFAVLVANLLTIALLSGAYYYLQSDHGQMMLYEMGLHSLLIPALRTPGTNIDEQVSQDGFTQRRLSDMKPMTVTPRSAPSTTQTPFANMASQPSSDRKRNLSAIRSSLEMCRFWNAEYRKDGSSQSKQYRDAACTRYERFSGRDSSNVVNLASSSSVTSNPSYQERLERRERQLEEQRKAEEKAKHESYCQGLREEIDHYDSLLRHGGSGYKVARWRTERREVSLEYSRKCLLGQ